MKIAIVEDETIYSLLLTEMLQKWAANGMTIEILSFTNGEELIRQYKQQKITFDVIFLDIKLQGITGLETAKILRELGFQNQIVFITSYQEFACRGYDVSAFNYLIKPIQYDEVAACLDKISEASDFCFNYKGELVKLPYNNILCFESEKHYLCIHTINLLLEKIPKRFRYSMSQLLNERLPQRFIQCHRSYIVNAFHVMKIKNKTLYMRDGSTLPIGNYYLNEFIERFQKYTF